MTVGKETILFRKKLLLDFYFLNKMKHWGSKQIREKSWSGLSLLWEPPQEKQIGTLCGIISCLCQRFFDERTYKVSTIRLLFLSRITVTREKRERLYPNIFQMLYYSWRIVLCHEKVSVRRTKGYDQRATGLCNSWMSAVAPSLIKATIIWLELSLPKQESV